jgi:hypothetical protein
MNEAQVSTANGWNDYSDGHRAKKQRKQHFAVTHEPTGFHVQCNHSIIETGGGSPRHHHNFEQARYVLEGHLSYGRKKYGPGTFIYIPESVYYGPQTREEQTRALIFQFPGPSGVKKFTNADAKRGQDELSAQGVTFHDGIATLPSGKKKDAYEAIWEHLAGRPIEYAPPRYEEPVYVYSKVFPWRASGRDGVSIKHLGYFNECGPNVSLWHLEPRASTPAGNVGWLEMRLIIEGEVEYAGQSCTAVSRIYCAPGTSYDEMTTRQGATLLVFQIAVPGGEAPRRG